MEDLRNALGVVDLDGDGSINRRVGRARVYPPPTCPAYMLSLYTTRTQYPRMSPHHTTYGRVCVFILFRHIHAPP